MELSLQMKSSLLISWPGEAKSWWNNPSGPNVITCMLSCLCHIQLFATPWTVAHQVPLSTGFPRQNTGMGCHFLLQGIFPTRRSNLCLLYPALAGEFVTTELPGKLSVITGVSKCGRERQKRYVLGERLHHLSIEDGREHGAQKCQWLMEAGRGERTSSLLEPLEKEFSPADTLILPQGDLFWTSDI